MDAKNEIDPDFVIMAQCYARNADNGGMAEMLKRLRLYEKEAGVDWVQFEAPHSVQEIKRARGVVKGPFSAMKGQLSRALTLEEHEAVSMRLGHFSPIRCSNINMVFFDRFARRNQRLVFLRKIERHFTGKPELGRDGHDRAK